MKIEKWINKTEDRIPSLISLLVVIVFLIGDIFLGYNFTKTILTFNTIALGILLSLIMMVAGFVVLKSLFLVAAELSLLIFISQSYCEVPNHLTSGDESLRSLFIIGLLYIFITFFRSLYKTTKEKYKKIKNERWEWKKITTILLYVLFTILFLWQIYKVMSPIILNLCIFR